MSDRYTWSDESGKVECTKENTKLPSKYWHWVEIFFFVLLSVY